MASTGLALNLQGEQLKDVGRVVIENQLIVFSAGPHLGREAIDGGQPIGEAPTRPANAPPEAGSR